MKYFIDTEFIEGFHKPLFGKRRHFIDLISIGIVCEDGREYYAISDEFKTKAADKWVQDNVIKNLHTEDGLKLCPDHWKSNNLIAWEITEFINNEEVKIHELGNGKVKLDDESYQNIIRGHSFPEFYAYYADYDWVLFCSLFGRIIDLPKGFPMYCNDLKQTLDEKASLITGDEKEYQLMSSVSFDENNKVIITDNKDLSLQTKVEFVKLRKDYPKQNNEHNALGDAKWNFELYKFLQRI